MTEIKPEIDWESRRWDLVVKLTEAVFNNNNFNLDMHSDGWSFDAKRIVGQVDAIIDRFRGNKE